MIKIQLLPFTWDEANSLIRYAPEKRRQLFFPAFLHGGYILFLVHGLITATKEEKKNILEMSLRVIWMVIHYLAILTCFVLYRKAGRIDAVWRQLKLTTIAIFQQSARSGKIFHNIHNAYTSLSHSHDATNCHCQ